MRYLHKEHQPTTRIPHQMADLELSDPNAATTNSSQVGCRVSQRGSCENFPQLAKPKKFRRKWKKPTLGAYLMDLKDPRICKNPKQTTIPIMIAIAPATRRFVDSNG